MQPGSELGRFRLLRVLDSDSRGETWLALDGDSPERNVALKLMTSLASQGPNATQRFVLETRHLARVRHPNLLPIHAVDTTQGLPWMAMEFAPAGDLRAGLETQPLACAAGLDVLTDVAAALDHLHRCGVVHRDLRPANLFRCDDGRVRLLLCQPAEAPPFEHAHWQAPERAKQLPPSPASDVYALGVIVFRWLAGVFPFEGEDDLSILLAHVAQPWPREPLRHLPDSAVDAIARALEKDAAQRYTTAGGFIEALRSQLTFALPADARSDAGRA